MDKGLSRKLKVATLRAPIPLKPSLARSYLRASEGIRSIHLGRDRQLDERGLPIPSSRLRVLVAGTADVTWFLNSGKAQANYLRSVLQSVGRPLDEMNSVLDFGCGCGRIARWFSDLPIDYVDGCDYNKQLVRWCNANLAFVRGRKTNLGPPLPYPDVSFDFLYAFSVFTHLSTGLAERWIAEFRRVIRPGGLIWFTIHGESYRERLVPEERARFDGGEIVVRLPEIEGTNLCCAYWPSGSVEKMLGGAFEVLVHLNPRADPLQAQQAVLEHDAVLARRL